MQRPKTAVLLLSIAMVGATLVPMVGAHELFEGDRRLETATGGDYQSQRIHDDSGVVTTDHWIDRGGAIWLETDEGFPCAEVQGTQDAPSACDGPDSDGTRDVRDMKYVDDVWGGSGVLSGPGWWACKDDNRDTGNLHSPTTGESEEPHHKRQAWESHSDAKAPHPNGEINPHVHVDDYFLYVETAGDDVPNIAQRVPKDTPGAQWAWPDYPEGEQVAGDEDYADGICESAFPSAPNDVDLDDEVSIQCGKGPVEEFNIWDVKDTRTALINGTEVDVTDTWHFGDSAEGVANNTEDGDFLAQEPVAGHEDPPGIIVTFFDQVIFQPLDCGNLEGATSGDLTAKWGV